MKRKKIKKILGLLIAVIVICSILYNVGAATNPYYSVDPVTDTNLNDAMEESSLLEAIAKLIYAIGRLLEWLLGLIFTQLTGVSDFPWADKIVFNAVPLLDVNFINPAKNSFVGGDIQKILKNLYSTILAMAVTFFGITVMITSVKLVLSTIASEKAKYKKAIVDWLVGFVMVFCIHYLISFIFYLNESLVVVASEIVSAQLRVADRKFEIVLDDLTMEAIKKVPIDAIYKGKNAQEFLKENKNIVRAFINLPAYDDADNLQELLMKGYHVGTFSWDTYEDKEKQIGNLLMIVDWASTENVSVGELRDIKANLPYYIASNKKETGQSVDIIKGPIGIMLGIFDLLNPDTYESANNLLSGYVIENEVLMKIFGIDEATISKYKGGSLSEFLKSNESAKIVSLMRFIEAAGIKNNEVKGILLDISDKPDVISKFINSGDYSLDYDDFSKLKCRRMVFGTDEVGNNNIFLALFNYIHADPETYGLKERSFYPDDGTYEWQNVLSDLITLKSASDVSTGKYIEGSGSSTTKLISNLASYFRYTAYERTFRSTNKFGLKDGDAINITSMIMYAVLVAQSLILFISYVKRLFYVIMLAMMAPIVVVFDFFQKFGK